jgi:hypothetical protein
MASIVGFDFMTSYPFVNMFQLPISVWQVNSMIEASCHHLALPTGDAKKTDCVNWECDDYHPFNGG